MAETSLLISFAENDLASDSTNTLDDRGFHPSVHPWMFWPGDPASIDRNIGYCDKWVLETWRAYDYHVPAITYKANVIASVVARLPAMYQNAVEQYAKELIQYINTQNSKKENSILLTYPPDPSKPASDPALTIVLGTTGVSNSSLTYTGGGSDPTANLSVYFSPTNTTTNAGGYGGDSDGSCYLLPWAIFYEGNPQWVWYKGGQWNSWLAGTQPNYVIASNPSRPAINYPVNTYTGYYFYYDPKYNANQFPAAYAVRQFKAVWDYVAKRTQLLSIYDLCRIWYIPQAINPVPVDPARILAPPATFPANVRFNAVFMKFAIGYIPPSGIKDAKATYQGGVRLDITSFCRYTPDPNSNLGGGRVSVVAFDFVDAIQNALEASTADVPDELMGQHGEHVIEVIDMGIEAYMTIYDDRSRATPLNVRHTPDINYYVPSLDTGDYIYRKKWKVFNPIDDNCLMIKYLYHKQYGRLGTKHVYDLMNPFDVEIIFCVSHNCCTGKYVFNNAVQSHSHTAVRVAANTTRRVTTYTDAEVTLFSGRVWVAGATMAGLADLATFGNDARDTYQIISDAVAIFPEVWMDVTNLEIDTPPIEIQIPATGGRFGIGNPAIGNYWHDHSGQFCTATLWQNDYDPETMLTTWINQQANYSCIDRIFSVATKSYVNPSYHPYGYETGSYKGTSFISKDIGTVYTHAQMSDRWDFFQWNWYYGTLAIGETRPIYKGGAVAWFCSSDYTFGGATGTSHDVSMRDRTYSTQYNNFQQYSKVQSNGQVYLENVGRGSVEGEWKMTNLVRDTTYPPNIQCGFRGKVLAGWDNSAIEVFVPYLEEGYVTSIV